MHTIRRLCLAGVALGALALPTPPLCAAADRLPKVRVAADGRTFVTETGRPYTPVGVNYYRPGLGWAPQIWKQFDPEATRRDFARMRELGLNCVRVFLTFGSFYMEPDKLSADGLRKFDQFLALAEEAGIYVHPTGPDHWEGLPEWGRKDRYADEKFLRALESFWQQFAARYRGRKALFAYDLLNEPAVPWNTPALGEKWNLWLARKYATAEKVAAAWAVPVTNIALGKLSPPAPKDAPASTELLDFQHFRESIADEWTRRQAAAIKRADPAALVTVGLIQWSVPALLPGAQHYSAFKPARQAQWLDFLEVHFYPLEGGFYEYAGPEDEARNLSYLESVVREVARAGKPVVVAEFGWYGGGKPTLDGGKHPFASEQQQANWGRAAVETTAGLAVGWLNWGLYDHPEARDVSQLTGLFTVEGKVKEWGRQLGELARSHRERAIPAVGLGHRPALDWELCITSPKAGKAFRDQYHQARIQAR